MKKTISLICAFLMLLGLMAGCGSSDTTAAQADTSTGGKLEQIQAAGKLVVCTDAAWAPFEYIGADGEVTGSDMELAKYIADALDVDLEIINASFDTLSTYLMNGDADLELAAVTITEERAETVAFSNPYTVAQQYIIVPETVDSVVTIEDLAGMAIGVHLGTTGDFLVSDEVDLPEGVLNGTGSTVKQYKFLTDACLALQNGELGAVVCDTLLAKNLCATNSGLKCFELAYADGHSTIEELAIAMAKGDDEFVTKINEIIDPIIADGTIDGWIVEHTALASELS